MGRAVRILPLLIVVTWGGLIVAAEAAPSLTWQLEQNDYVHYEVVEEDLHDSLNPGARWGEIADMQGFFGYEVSGGRVPRRDLTEEAWLRLPFIFRLPSKGGRIGAEETITERIPATYRTAGVRAVGKMFVRAIRKGDTRTEIDLGGIVTFTPWDLEPEKAHQSFRYIQHGRITWTSTFDTTLGLVTRVIYDLSFRSDLAAAARPTAVSNYEPRPRTYRGRYTIELDRVYEHRYEGFQRDVDAAIDVGCTYLESQALPSGPARRRRTMGSTALSLLALIKGGRGTERPYLQRGVSWVIDQEPSLTYEVGCAMMAVEAFRTPAREMDLLRRGILTEPGTRVLRPKERAFMERCAAFLIKEGRRDVEPERPVTGAKGLYRWGYPRSFNGRPDRRRERYWDNSNTQYAVLGLNCAARCGIEIPRDVWSGVAHHFLSVQQPDGPMVKRLRLRRHAREAKPRSRYANSTATFHARARGWMYHDASHSAFVLDDTGKRHATRGWGRLPYGSMTVAGIASLAIARSHLNARKQRHEAAFMEKIDEAILDGWAALSTMWSAIEHPLYDGWYLYYLYGLERAGILADAEWVGGHDWYWEGAIQLILRRKKIGHWTEDRGHEISTAWAVLFLARGTAPVITPSER